jgi:SpoVK/Ycf46/Vps4 family AAA+-type ATPase
MFDYARTTPCVLFFDEFDAIGKERGDKHETGEIKRVISSLLMQIDELPSYTTVIAATNHAELLDRAVWRRFQLRLELPKPEPNELARFIDRLLHRFRESAGMSADSLARKLGDVSYSEAEQFCLDVLRRHTLAMGERPLKAIVAEQLKIWNARVGALPETMGDVSRAGTSSPQAYGSRAR